MGHNYNKGEAEIPAWRTDVLHEVDLIEDIAIAYGYDKFEPEIPKISTIGKINPRENFKRKIAEILTGLGLMEISNYHLTKIPDQFTKMGVPEKSETGFVILEKSKTDYTILRKDLAHYALKILSENVDSEYPQRIFEVGKIFELKNKEVIETEKLSVAITPGNFTELRQIIEYLSKMINKKIEIKETENPPEYFVESRVAEIFHKDKSLGFLGEIHPKILNSWRIKMPVALLEISLENLFED